MEYNKKLKISVIMATYNGSRFIEKQLHSLLAQTRLPDEVIFRDDVSSDNTVQIIEKFIKINELENWKIICNEKNLGYIKNFYKLLDDASGDIIFFSDQDDIWYSDKIYEMSKILEENKNILHLYGFADVIDENDKNIDIKWFSNTIKKEYLKQIEFNITNIQKTVPGCVSCFKKEVFYKLIKYISKNLLFSFHPDILVYRYSCLLDKSYSINRNIIKHRIHSANASRSNININFFYLKDRLKGINSAKSLFSVWIDVLESEYSEKDLKKINSLKYYRVFYEKRILFLKNPNIKFFLCMLKRYKRKSERNEIYRDLIYVTRLNYLFILLPKLFYLQCLKFKRFIKNIYNDN